MGLEEEHERKIKIIKFNKVAKKKGKRDKERFKGSNN
jgi:hypothetical protein